MSFLLWSDQLSVGREVIDNEHKQLIAIINDLHDALAAGHERQEIGLVIERMLRYTRSHFAYEEAILLRCGYPDFAAHKREHDAMVAWAASVQDRFEQGDTSALSQEVLVYLKDWFYDHVGRVDQNYVAYLSQNDCH
jgi:hemerythrin